MKDAIGGSLLLNLVVIFSSIIILFFSGILAYSKAYKVKNKIIEIIESHNGQIMEDNDGLIDSYILDEIKTELINVGYLVTGAPSDEKCTRDSSRGNCKNLNTDNFNYCICYHGEGSATGGAVKFGTSYEIITYTHFSFPVIGDLLMFPVRGETKVLGKDYNY